jgi:16S rRNA (cytosine967-C5)-methyltransferase
MPSEARACAYAVLRRVFEHDAYAEQALRSQARDLPARERAQAMRLAYGAIQRKGTLDHLVQTLAERSPQRLDPPVLAALRLGLYELLYLRGAPDHAVVADAVELAKRSGRAGHGLVNAVLRRAARGEGPALLAGLREDTPAQAAVKHSHPDWIAQLWWEQLGPDDARALMAADNEPSELALRANTLLTDAPTLARALASEGDVLHDATRGGVGPRAAAADSAAAEETTTGAPATRAAAPKNSSPGASAAVRTRPDPLIPEALVLEGRFDLHASPLWRQGAFVAQSRAAMLVARALAPLSGERVLDLCAAPGNKSTHLAALMDGRGEVLAIERDRRRAGTLARTAERLHAHNVRVQIADAALPRPEGPVFDRVLIDPPCSGLGTLQARPDLRWRMTPARLPELERIQARILAAGAAALRPGGLLVYSTCTISPTENELRIAAFLDANPDFALDDLGAELPGLRHPAPGARQAVLTLPHRDRTAGFFIARLRRG